MSQNDNKLEIFWAIGGSDSCAGAGVQADIKTASSFGIHACSVVTALTAQNSFTVDAINPISIAVLDSQIKALEQDLLPKVIKVGLLANQAQVLWLIDKLATYKQCWPTPPVVVLDPVMIASSGNALTSDDTISLMRHSLLPLVDVLCANWHEAQVLAMLAPEQREVDQLLAARLRQLGVEAVAIKGGHRQMANVSRDLLATAEKTIWLDSPRLENTNVHGTGCSFASVISSAICQGYSIADSMVLAKAYVYQGIRTAIQVGKGADTFGHGAVPRQPNDYPVLVACEPKDIKTLGLSERGFARCGTTPLGLYPVVDSVEWVEKLVKLGVNTIQLRLKSDDRQTLVAQIQQANQVARKHHARLFINDHWQLAIDLDCYGVHLGQEDLLDADLLAIQRAGLRLGISTHGYIEMLNALRIKPSYIAVGAIFPTRTKDMTGQIQGVNRLADYLPLLAGYPVVAIGGITLDNLAPVVATGVGSVAVVTAITQANKPEEVVALFQQRLDDAQQQ